MRGARRAAMIALPLLACALWAVHGGRDLHWDLLHYHVYGPHSLLHGRLGRDFFPAGLQSYLNPLPHLPFYAMLLAGWHSVLIAAALAAIQGLALVFLYGVSRGLLPQRTRMDAALCVLLGAASVTFLSNVGRTFSDITTALPTLAGIWVLSSHSLRTPPLRAMGAAGLLLGIAAGLKLTNGIFLVAAMAWPLLATGPRLRLLAAYAIGGAVGMLAAGGWWALLLWREFESPVFPLFNALFRSPDFPPVNISFDRYRPQDLEGFVLAPARMALPEPMVYGELTAPDLRFLLLLAALALLPFAGRLGLTPRGEAQPRTGLAPILVFFAVAYALWVATTFNARYASVLLLLVGPVIGATLARLLAGSAYRIALVCVVAAQGFAILQVSPTRLSPADPYAWSRSWLGFRVPQQLREQPYLYLSIDGQSFSFLATDLHPDSAFATVRGDYAVHLDGPGGGRLASLLARYAGRVRTLGNNALEQGAREPHPDWLRHKNIGLGRLGLAVDPGDCLPIESDERVDALAETANRLVGVSSRVPKRFIMSCALRQVPVSESFLLGRVRADAVFDAAERACPRAFPPGLARAEQDGNLWVRSYASTERELAWTGTQVFTVSRVTGRGAIVAESAADVPAAVYQCP